MSKEPGNVTCTGLFAAAQQAALGLQDLGIIQRLYVEKTLNHSSFDWPMY